jgi:circadian clock protein KaiC
MRPKTPTGILGLDEIAEGGIPSGRPTLVCGGPGCGKTLLSMHLMYKEPRSIMSLEFSWHLKKNRMNFLLM